MGNPKADLQVGSGTDQAERGASQPTYKCTKELQVAIVIMAGGAGTRFWPVSVESCPKQFLNLFGSRSLIQMSYDRVADLVPNERIFVLTNQRFEKLVKEHLPEIPAENVIGEPLRKDTAAAIALAALLCQRRFGEATMAVLTADHIIGPVDLFQRTLLSAVQAARANDTALYTFGVQPTFPATGYGYLQRGAELETKDGISHYRLRRFKEKPDRATAEKYLESGEYYWNSGMFVWSTAAILSQLDQHLPEHTKHLHVSIDEKGDIAPSRLEAAFRALQPISIDFGVMEKAEDVRCVASTFDWNDVGGWLALQEYLEHDEADNVFRGELRKVQASNNLVYCEDQDELVALVGVENLVLVRAGKRTLIVDRRQTEKIKDLVKSLEPGLK